MTPRSPLRGVGPGGKTQFPRGGQWAGSISTPSPPRNKPPTPSTSWRASNEAPQPPATPQGRPVGRINQHTKPATQQPADPKHQLAHIRRGKPRNRPELVGPRPKPSITHHARTGQSAGPAAECSMSCDQAKVPCDPRGLQERRQCASPLARAFTHRQPGASDPQPPEVAPALGGRGLRGRAERPPGASGRIAHSCACEPGAARSGAHAARSCAIARLVHAHLPCGAAQMPRTSQLAAAGSLLASCTRWPFRSAAVPRRGSRPVGPRRHARGLVRPGILVRCTVRSRRSTLARA